MPAHPLRKRYVDTARGLIHLQEAGEVGRPALVLVTLTSFAAPLLDEVLPALADRGWHVLALDIMGYGRSDKRDTHWLIEDFADNLIEAIAACGVAPVGLACGHLASLIGIEIAARRQGGVRALPMLRGLSIDGTPRFTPEQRAERSAAGLPEPTPWDEAGGHALAYWQKVWRIIRAVDPTRALAPVPTERFRDAVMALMEASVYEPNTAMAANCYALETKLPLVDLPTLVMCSDTDWNLPHHDAIVAALPDPRPLRLEGVNPVHAIDAPGRAVEYADHLHAFFAPLCEDVLGAPTSTRLPLLRDDQVGPPALVAAIRQRRGGALIDLDRLLLHSPPFAAGWGELMGRVRGALGVPPLLRELAMCGVSVLTGAAFEIEAHARLYCEAGGTDAQLDALRGFHAGTRCDPLFDARQQAVLGLTYEMTRTVAVADATFARAREAMGSDALVFELVAVIAAYNMVGRILVALKS